MNRQQRRAIPLLTRGQWIEELIALSKTSPGLPDELSIGQLLLEIITTEQHSLQTESLAVLCGLAASYMAHMAHGFPVAKHADAQGRPIYTEADVAQYVGATVDQVRAEIDQMKAAGELDGCIFPLSADDVNPLH